MQVSRLAIVTSLSIAVLGVEAVRADDPVAVAQVIPLCSDDVCDLVAPATGRVEVCFDDLVKPRRATDRPRFELSGGRATALVQRGARWCTQIDVGAEGTIVDGSRRRTLRFPEPDDGSTIEAFALDTTTDWKAIDGIGLGLQFDERAMSLKEPIDFLEGSEPVEPVAPPSAPGQPVEPIPPAGSPSAPHQAAKPTASGEPTPPTKPQPSAPIPSSAAVVVAPAALPDDRGFLDVVIVGTQGRYHCSGIMVAPDAVLTAAHCAPATEIAMGHRTAALFVRAAVTAVIVHPSLDAALLRLDRALPATVRARRRAGMSSPPRGTMRMVGFGVDDPRYPTSFGVKRRVDASVTSWGCDSGRARSSGCRVGAELVVADVGGRDTCAGDSGGPVLEIFDDSLRLVAITSRPTAGGGAVCGHGGVYVRVDVLDPWLTSLLEDRP